MYTLRTMTAENKQINQLIGDCYSIVDREFSYDEFKDIFKDVMGKDHVNYDDSNSDDYSKNIYSFLQSYGVIIPLYKGCSYYIMTETGKTFSNISYKI